ncbi:MAG: ferritin-like domain-containing protein, partial [Chloroflexi bacterium]|nr:ferritin-like domain-containing protein [Chloroflexota bacterium]
MVDLDDLGLEAGGHILVKRQLAGMATGDRIQVRGRHPELHTQLRAWARQNGHQFIVGAADQSAWLVKGASAGARHAGALRTGNPNPAEHNGLANRAAPEWGLAARGAAVEAGGPTFDFALDQKDEVWTDSAPRLYALAAAAQWDPAVAIDWAAGCDLPTDLERAVVQVMTYLIENENAALLVPARHLGQVHPHFREAAQLLAIQCADEARHVEVFTRRAT